MKKSEKEIERYLVDKVKARGGIAYKWTSPGNNGVPDRIVFMPSGSITFVELKSESRKPKLDDMQEVQARKLARMQQTVYVANSYVMVDRLLGEVIR